MVFLNFLLFFWNFILRVEWEQNGTIVFIFYLFQPYPTYFDLKPQRYFFNFLAIFLEFSIPVRVRIHRNDFFFYFLSFSAFPHLFWLEK